MYKDHTQDLIPVFHVTFSISSLSAVAIFNSESTYKKKKSALMTKQTMQFNYILVNFE